jgi:hypothetical protein
VVRRGRAPAAAGQRAVRPQAVRALPVLALPAQQRAVQQLAVPGLVAWQAGARPAVGWPRVVRPAASPASKWDELADRASEREADIQA